MLTPLPAAVRHPYEASVTALTVALGNGIAAVYSFPSDVLDDWKEFDPQMRIWLGQIGAL